MSFSVIELRQKVAAKRIPKGRLARAIGKSPSYISEILSGMQRPSDEIARRIQFVFAFIDSAEVQGDFVFDRAGVLLLRRKIREMEVSIMPSSRPQAKEEESTEEQPCAN